MSCGDDVVPIITNVFSLAGGEYGEFLMKENKANATKNILSKIRLILPKSTPAISEGTSPVVPAKIIESSPKGNFSKVGDPFKGIPEKIINDLAVSVCNEFPPAGPVFIVPKSSNTSLSQTMASTSITVVGSKSVTVASNLNSKNNSVKSSILSDVSTHSKPITTAVSHAILQEVGIHSKPITTIVPPDENIKNKSMHTVVPLSVIMQENKPIPANYINLTDKIPVNTPNPQRILAPKRTPTSKIRILPKEIAPKPVIPQTVAAVKDATSHNVPLPVDTITIPIDKHPLSALHRTVGSIPDSADNASSVVNMNVPEKGKNSFNSIDIKKHECVTVKVEHDDTEKSEPDNAVNVNAVIPAEKVSAESIEEEEAKAIAASLFISPTDTSSESNWLSQSSTTDSMKDICLSDGYQCIIDDSLPMIVSDIRKEVIDNDEISDDTKDSPSTVIDVDKEKKNKVKKDGNEDTEVESSSEEDDDGAYERSDDSEYDPDEDESSSSDGSGSDADDGTSKKKHVVKTVNNLAVSAKIIDKMKAIQCKNIPILPATMLNAAVNPVNPILSLPTDTICDDTDVALVKNINNPTSRISQVATPLSQMVIPPIQKVIPPAQMISSAEMAISPAQSVTGSNAKDLNCKTSSVCLSQVLDILNMKKNQLPTSTNNIVTSEPTQTPHMQATQQQPTQISTQPVNKNLSRTFENIALLKQLEKKQENSIGEARSKLVKGVQNIKRSTSDENITTNIKCEKCNKQMFSLVELVSHKCVIENEIQRALSKSVLENAARVIENEIQRTLSKSVLENAALQKMAECVIKKEKSLSQSIGDCMPVVTSLVNRQSPAIESRLPFSTGYNFSTAVTQVPSSHLSVASSAVAWLKPMNVPHVQTPVATTTPVPASLTSTKPTMTSPISLSSKTVPMYLVAQQSISGNPGQMMLVPANAGNSSAVPLKFQQIPGGGLQLVAQSTSGLPVLMTSNNAKPIYVHNLASTLGPRVRPVVSQVCNSITHVRPMSPGTLRNSFRASSATNTFMLPARLNIASNTSTVQLLKRAQMAPIPITCISSLKRAQTPIPITCISSASCSTSSSHTNTLNSKTPSVASATYMALSNISSAIIKKEPSDTNDSKTGIENIVTFTNTDSNISHIPWSISSNGAANMKIDADLPALQLISGNVTTVDPNPDPTTNLILIQTGDVTKAVQSSSSFSNPTINIPSSCVAKPVQEPGTFVTFSSLSKPSIKMPSSYVVKPVQEPGVFFTSANSLSSPSIKIANTYVAKPVLESGTFATSSVLQPTCHVQQPVEVSSSLINPSKSTSLLGQENTTTFRIANITHSMSSAVATVLPIDVSSLQNKLPASFSASRDANSTHKLVTNSIVSISNTQNVLPTLKDNAETRSTSSSGPSTNTTNYHPELLNTRHSLVYVNNISHNAVKVSSTPALQDKKVTASPVTTSAPTYTVINSLKDTKINITALGKVLQSSKVHVGNQVSSLNIIDSKSLNVSKCNNMFIELNQKRPVISTSDLSINLIGKCISTGVGTTTSITSTVPISVLAVSYTNMTTTTITTNTTESLGKTVNNIITPGNFVIKNKHLTLVNTPNRVPVSPVNGITNNKPPVQNYLNPSRPVEATIRPVARPMFRVDINNPKRIVQSNVTNQTRPQPVQIFNIPRTLTPPKFSNVSIRNVLAVNNNMASNANKLFLSNSQFIKVDGQQHVYCVISKNSSVSNQHIVIPGSGLPSTCTPSTAKPSVPSLSNPITSYLPTTGPLGVSSQRNIPVTIRPDILKNFPISMTAVSKGSGIKPNHPTSTSLIDLNIVALKSEDSTSSAGTVDDIQSTNSSAHVPIQLGLTEKLFTMSGKKRLKHKLVANRYDTKFASSLGFELCAKELADEYFNIKKGALNVDIDVRDYLASFWIKKPSRPKVSPRYDASPLLKQHLGSSEKDGREVSSKCIVASNTADVSSHNVFSQQSVSHDDTVTTQCYSEHMNSEQCVTSCDVKRTEIDQVSEKTVNEIGAEGDEDMLFRKRKNGMLEDTPENKKQKTYDTDCTDRTSTENEVSQVETVRSEHYCADTDGDTEDIDRNIFDILNSTKSNSCKRVSSSECNDNNKKIKTNFTGLYSDNECMNNVPPSDDAEFVDSDSRDSVDIDLLTPTKLNPRVLIKKIVES